MPTIHYTCAHPYHVHRDCEVARARLAAKTVEVDAHGYRHLSIAGVPVGRVEPWTGRGEVYTLTGTVNLGCGGGDPDERVILSQMLDGVFGIREDEHPNYRPFF